MFRFERSNRWAIKDEKPFSIINIFFLLLASIGSDKNGSLAIQGELSYYILFQYNILNANLTNVIP